MTGPVLIFSLPMPPLPWTDAVRDGFTEVLWTCPLHLRQAVDRPRLISVLFHKTREAQSTDPDALHANAKFVLDTLVQRRWVISDSPQHVELVTGEEIDEAPLLTLLSVSEGWDDYGGAE